MPASEERILLHGHVAEQHLPEGRVWARRIDSTLRKVLEALGIPLAEVDERFDEILIDANPQTTTNMLVDWERWLGLPAPCADLEVSVLRRRFAVVTRLTQEGGQSAAFMIALAAALGYTITVVERLGFRCGISTCTDPVGEAWAFAWAVKAAPQQPTFFQVGQNGAGDPLVASSNELLECTLRLVTPGHTVVSFEYDQRPTPTYAPWEFGGFGTVKATALAVPIIVQFSQP